MTTPRCVQRLLASVLVVALMVTTMSCGTIIYPERRGQPAGKLDIDIVILDAVGLLILLVPGVIAFAVDFSTGAIYLPPGGKSKASDLLGGIEIERYKLNDRTAVGIEAAVLEHTEFAIDLRKAGISMIPDSHEVVEAQLRRIHGEILRKQPKGAGQLLARAGS